MAAMLIFLMAIIVSKARVASPPPAASADDRVPVTVRVFLILRRDLEERGLGVPERRM
jgi:hypothetical protein